MTMTDRELLELAAKAAGKLFNPTVRNKHGLLVVKDGADCQSEQELWNPLTDDGDALRLAAVLRLQVKPGKHKGDGCTVETQRDGIAGCTAFYDDEAQQMRQAIVRAAAEIGRSQ